MLWLTGSGTKKGRRPSVSAIDTDIVINLHISHDQVTISLDSSVVPLFKRGYRKEQGPAPLNEVLAAGIVLLSGVGRRNTIARSHVRIRDNTD